MAFQVRTGFRCLSNANGQGSHSDAGNWPICISFLPYSQYASLALLRLLQSIVQRLEAR